MMPRCALILFILIPLISQAQPTPSNLVSHKFRNAVQARIDTKYALVINRDGSRNLVPVESIRPSDMEWLREISAYQSIEQSSVTEEVVPSGPAAPDKAKKTILRSETVNGVEYVQLCPPNVFFDQIGGTCMLYARVHWLDIAGYYTTRGDINLIINGAPPNSPWDKPGYVTGLSTIIYDRPAKPKVHPALPYGDNFEWARAELRKGRPLLAALPREIWQALPTDFLAQRVWSGGSIGHQIVVNGFSYDPKSDTGTFHVINSWNELTEFDLKLRDARNGNLVFEQSMSPYGEVIKQPKGEVIQSVQLIKEVGQSRMYRIITNKGAHRVMAPDEAAARTIIEKNF